MLLELCLVLRMVLNDGDHVALRNISVLPCTALSDSQIDDTKQTILQEPKEPTSPAASDLGTQNVQTKLKDIWAHTQHESKGINEQDSRRVNLRSPYSVTKLAKTIAYGFDPYFSKGYFEPFERRPKVVTLVSFRKNGLIPKKKFKPEPAVLQNVAEMQSPFNDLSNFWMDPPAAEVPA